MYSKGESYDRHCFYGDTHSKLDLRMVVFFLWLLLFFFSSCDLFWRATGNPEDMEVEIVMGSDTHRQHEATFEKRGREKPGLIPDCRSTDEKSDKFSGRG